MGLRKIARTDRFNSADTGDFHSVKPLILYHSLQIPLRIPVQYQLRTFQRRIVDQPVQLTPLIHIIRPLVLHSNRINRDHCPII